MEDKRKIELTYEDSTRIIYYLQMIKADLEEDKRHVNYNICKMYNKLIKEIDNLIRKL